MRQVGLAPGPTLGLMECLTVGVDLDAEDGTLEERFAAFLRDVEDGHLGSLMFSTDDERERLFLESRNT